MHHEDSLTSKSVVHVEAKEFDLFHVQTSVDKHSTHKQIIIIITIIIIIKKNSNKTQKVPYSTGA